MVRSTPLRAREASTASPHARRFFQIGGGVGRGGHGTEDGGRRGGRRRGGERKIKRKRKEKEVGYSFSIVSVV
jgi:hypothetical protein